MKRLFSVLFFMFCAAVCSAAESPVGVIQSFSVDGVSEVKNSMISCLWPVAVLFGGLIGYVFLEWAYHRIDEHLNPWKYEKYHRTLEDSKHY